MNLRWERARRPLKVAAVGLVLLGWGLYLARSVDRASLVATLTRARALPLVLGVAAIALSPLARAACWKAILVAPEPVAYRLLLRYTLAGNAANAVLPARAGDAMRVWLLRDRHGVPAANTAAALVLEKAADLLAMGLLVAPLPWLLPGNPTRVAQALAAMVALAVLLVGALALARGRIRRHRWLAGLAILDHPFLVARGLLAVLVTWLLDLGCVLLVLSAVGLPPHLADALLVLLFVNLAIAVPVTPGQVGTHELGAVTALRLQGVAPEHAVAFALLYHAVQLGPAVILGLLDARGLLATRARR
jgi:uncharacterized membrane protein YbhN (UPF0104 family)